MAPLPGLLLAGMGYHRRWVSEDAFIGFRVVRHVLAGYGPVFNLGERVEVYTSPLWIALLAAWQALGRPVEVGSVAFGLLLSCAGLVGAQAGAWRLAERLHEARGGSGPDAADVRLALPLGAVVFAALPVAWDFTTSGLETGLAIAWLGGVFWLLAGAREMTSSRARVAAFAIGSGPLIRPDCGLFSVGFGCALLVIERYAAGRRLTAWRCGELGVIAAALPLGYQVFRMGYFAALVPNTALAKEAGLAYWSQGWRYTLDFIGTYALWLPLLVVTVFVVALVRSARRGGHRVAVALVLAPILSGLAHWLYVTRVGGDFMHGRLLLLSLFAVLLPLATVIVPVAGLVGWRRAALAGVAAWAIVSALWLRVPYPGTVGPWLIADERGFSVHYFETPNPVRIEDYARHPALIQFSRRLLEFNRAVTLTQQEDLSFIVTVPLATSAPSSIRLVLGLANIGMLGYLAGPSVHVVDRLGLADPIGARLQLTVRDRPGHEKWLPEAWVLARFADPQAAVTLFPGRREAARALGCGDLALLLRAIGAPLTPSRFLASIRASWRLSRLRLPSDPAAAAQQLCGS